jgi:hypothetical protein
MTKRVVERYIDVSLKTIRDLKLGPTMASRLLYLSSVLIHYIISCYHGGKRSCIREIEIVSLLGMSEEKLDYFLFHSFRHLFITLNYPLTYLVEPVRKPWTVMMNLAYEKVKTFIDARDQDGWKNSSVGFTPPNGSHYIDVEHGMDQDLPNLLPQKTLWTPLKHQGAPVQGYLTPNWGEVVPPGYLDLSCYHAIADENYKPEYRAQEIDELLSEYKLLNDEKRMIAEHFQGGQVTPPGYWNILALYVLKNTEDELFDFSEFYYLLNTGIFTAGIVAWGVKKRYMQARPIQEIRCMTPPRMVTNYDGELVDNREWRAFQQHDFQAPPFADYISGHSTFSSVSAVLFEHYYPHFFQKNTIIPFDQEHCQMINSILDNEYSSNIRCANIKISSSEIQHPTKAFPVGACRLDFTSWRHIANLSGISRIYGGIHANNANVVGLIIGEKIGRDILQRYL